MPTKPEGWQKRQAAIRDLLARGAVRSQTELLKKLAARGFRATQSSVSRDLREMHVAKADGQYVLPEALASNGTPAARPPQSFALIRSVRLAGPSLVVVQTPPGGASVVGLAIDGAGWPDVVGTVAGDDTLFVATATRADQARVASRLQQLRERRSS